MAEARERLSLTALRRRFVGAATERLGIKVAALFFALVLWLVVSAEEPTEELIPVRFAPALDSTLRLDGPLPTVQALIIGRGRELLKLYSMPPVVHRIVTADAPDTLRLELTPADVDLPPGIEAIVRDVQPRSVTLRFNAYDSRVLPVQTRLRVVPESLARLVGTPIVEPDSVTVIGRRRPLRRLDAIPTLAETVMVGDTATRVVPLDTTGLGVRVRPARVQLRVPLRAPLAPDSATAPAAPAARGTPAAGVAP